MLAVFRPGNRVLVVAILAAVAVAAFPPWLAEVHGPRALDGVTMAQTTKAHVVERAFALGEPPEPGYGDECEMSRFVCHAHPQWRALAPDIGLVVLLAAAGWFVDRRWHASRSHLPVKPEISPSRELLR